MASLGPQNHHEVVVPNHVNGNVKYVHEEQREEEDDDDNSSNFDYSQRGQWLRAAILGANDGLLSVASLMMGVGAVKEDVKAMLLAGFAGTIAGASSMAIGEFVSVHTQYDVELSQMKRDMNRGDHDKVDAIRGMEKTEKERKKKKKLPNPFQAALASAFSFAVGALIPLLAAAFIRDYKVRLMVVVVVASLALVVFGALGSVVGKTPNVAGSCFRVLAGGWIAMAITFGLTKLMGSKGLQF